MPNRKQIVGYALLVTLLAAAIVSIDLLPAALAQGEPSESENSDSRPDRSISVTTDQAMSPDRSLRVPAVSKDETQSIDSTKATQVSLPAGSVQTSNQISKPDTSPEKLVAQRLDGNDACDDVSGPDSPSICDTPIETRSAEFARKVRPQLSAEQRILAQQNPSTTGIESADGAARRLSINRASDLSNDDLAIASVAIGVLDTRRPTDDETTDIPTDATGAIDAILGAINVRPPE